MLTLGQIPLHHLTGQLHEELARSRDLLESEPISAEEPRIEPALESQGESTSPVAQRNPCRWTKKRSGITLIGRIEPGSLVAKATWPTPPWAVYSVRKMVEPLAARLMAPNTPP